MAMIKFTADYAERRAAQSERRAEINAIRRRLREIRLQRLASEHLSLDGFQARQRSRIIYQVG